MWMEKNPNPVGRRVSDCSVRAVCLALDIDWETAYMAIAINGMRMGDMMDVNTVWGSVLRQNGFQRAVLPNTCPDCYTVRDFCRDHPRGVFVLGLPRHVVCAINGDWNDTWDSGDEPVLFYWRRKEK